MKNPNRHRINLFLIIILVLSPSIGQTPNPWKWIDTLPQPWTLSEEEITNVLPEFQKRFPDFQDRLKAFAIWRVGTPYEIFKLGEEVEPDPDPIIRLDVSDCTGHILTSLAFVKSTSWDEARKNMIDIHYKPDERGVKKPTYKTRWHFTSDRITANPYTINITESLLPKDKLASVKITLNKQQDGSQFLDLDWSRDVILYYIPNDKIDEDLLKNLPDVCGVAFVRKTFFDKGIAIGHEGMIIDQQDLIHASQSAGKTVRINFLEFYFPEDGPFFDGIMIYIFKELN